MHRSHIYPDGAPLLLLLIPLLILSSCGPNFFPQAKAQTGGSLEQRIDAAHHSFRVVQFCLDTPPLFPTGYFHQAARQVSDRIDALTTVNQDGLVLYVSLIGHDSLQTSVLTITVPAIPADPPQPKLKPLPSSAQFNSPYDYAQALDSVKKENANALLNWQVELKANHTLLSQARAQVKSQTDKLRTLTAPYDNVAADVWGCLDLSSLHFRNVRALKSLVIASPLINNSTVQESNINLSSAVVNVIYHSCTIASTCQANDSYWQQVFLSSHARSVSFYDLAQSQASLPAF